LKYTQEGRNFGTVGLGLFMIFLGIIIFIKRRSKAHVHEKVYKRSHHSNGVRKSKKLTSTRLKEEKLGTNVIAQSKRDFKKDDLNCSTLDSQSSKRSRFFPISKVGITFHMARLIYDLGADCFIEVKMSLGREELIKKIKRVNREEGEKDKKKFSDAKISELIFSFNK
jgi:hypothetical protein